MIVGRCADKTPTAPRSVAAGQHDVESAQGDLDLAQALAPRQRAVARARLVHEERDLFAVALACCALGDLDPWEPSPQRGGPFRNRFDGDDPRRTRPAVHSGDDRSDVRTDVDEDATREADADDEQRRELIVGDGADALGTKPSGASDVQLVANIEQPQPEGSADQTGFGCLHGVARNSAMESRATATVTPTCAAFGPTNARKPFPAAPRSRRATQPSGGILTTFGWLRS
jgi:hypothetical protein